jgi:uncharacterized protein YndB with AHSA1/START domain
VTAETTTSSVIVRVARTYQGPPEEVFDAWVAPEEIRHWMFGPETGVKEVVDLSVDPRAGG